MPSRIVFTSKPTIKQDVLKQTASSLDELLHLSCREASEHTAAAALTELRNNNNHHHHHHLKNKPIANSNAIVTSILSKNHIDHLEANSVSVIPIDTANNNKHNNGNISITGTGPNATNANRISVKKSLGQINAAVTLNQMHHMHAAMPPEAATALEMHRLTQLQQHLETAAVLMDISKKVIISPPSSNPQSPGMGDAQQNVKMTIKRTSGDETEATATKRMKSNAKGNNITTTIYQLDSNVRPNIRVKSESMFGGNATANSTTVAAAVDDSEGARYDSDNDSNDSDPGRLEMDISSSHDNDDGNSDAGRCSSSPVKLVYKHNRSFNNNTPSGRDTPESNKSDDHRTDPATTQLWQALARSTGKCEFHIFGPWTFMVHTVQFACVCVLNLHTLLI